MACIFVLAFCLALDVLLWFLLLVKPPHLQHISAGGLSFDQCVFVLSEMSEDKNFLMRLI